MNSDALTPKQRRFVNEYLIDLSATQAAIRAGYSQRTAEAIGFENLRNPNITAAIEEAQDQRSKRTQVTQDWVIDQLKTNAKVAMGVKNRQVAAAT